jgi:hypothetical protein
MSLVSAVLVSGVVAVLLASLTIHLPHLSVESQRMARSVSSEAARCMPFGISVFISATLMASSSQYLPSWPGVTSLPVGQ